MRVDRYWKKFFNLRDDSVDTLTVKHVSFSWKNGEDLSSCADFAELKDVSFGYNIIIIIVLSSRQLRAALEPPLKSSPTTNLPTKTSVRRGVESEKNCATTYARYEFSIHLLACTYTYTTSCYEYCAYVLAFIIINEIHPFYGYLPAYSDATNSRKHW